MPARPAAAFESLAKLEAGAEERAIEAKLEITRELGVDVKETEEREIRK
jgi:hypothetical protein